jgi:feruloyl-CoA synthase
VEPVSLKEIPFAEVNFAARDLLTEHRADGSIILKTNTPLGPYPQQLSDYLRHWSDNDPDRKFLVERDPAGAWRPISYGQAVAAADSISQALIDLGISSTKNNTSRPVVTLGGNSIEMGLLSLGAMQIGVPFAPISPSYSLMSEDFSKLKYIIDLIDPALVYVPEAAPFKNALENVMGPNVQLVSGDGAPGLLPFTDLTNKTPGAGFTQAYNTVTGDSIAKYLFTSGSTGMPKAVITTQRMLCSNATTVCQLLPVLEDHPPIIVDWLPWNHVAAGNLNFNVILRTGGTYYLDMGQPKPGEFETTINNLKDIQPTYMHNVPLVYERLAPYLEEDDEFARHLFGNMDFMLYAAAPMPAPVQQRLNAISAKAVGKRIPFISSLGSTETAPACIMCHWPSEAPGNLGLPMPGVDIKLVPNAGKLEMRVSGPNVTSCYLDNEQATKDAFDEDGFYCMGDAVKFVDPDNFEEGLQFDGRVSENFKLTSGTWVQTGEVRVGALTAISPLAQDAAVTGDMRDEIGLLLFLNQAECVKAFDLSAETTLAELAENSDLRARIKEKLIAHNREQKGSSRRITRLMIMTEPPSVQDNEITDKGYLNQMATLTARQALVERLYEDDPAVLVLS